jgi:hypothetical protein
VAESAGTQRSPSARCGRAVVSNVGRSAVAALVAVISALALAQTEEAVGLASSQVEELVAGIERELDCDITVHGTPRFDESSNAWLVAYSAAGADCDAAAAELADSGRSLGATFYRRPNAAQVRGLVEAIRADVSRAFPCRIMIVGTPRFDEHSAYWSVNYRAAGVDCAEAGRELGRRGRELQITFFGGPEQRQPFR